MCSFIFEAKVTVRYDEHNDDHNTREARRKKKQYEAVTEEAQEPQVKGRQKHRTQEVYHYR